MDGTFLGWPGETKAAVSLTFDDAAPSQLDHAIPIMNYYQVHGTFYVNPGESGIFERRIDEWRRAHDRGHELGNHTVAHPCSGNFQFIGEERALELWSEGRIEADIADASKRLRQLVPGIGEFSFAYPCGQTFVGRGSNRQSYVPVVAKHFQVARGIGESANDPRVCDLHCLSSWMVSGLTAEALVAMLEPAVKAGHWAIFCFHGIGGDHIRTEREAFETLVGYLAERQTSIWTGTVQSIGSFVGKDQVK